MEGADCVGLAPSDGVPEMGTVLESEPMVTARVQCTACKGEEAEQSIKKVANGGG